MTTRFILLASQRTGSTLIWRTLAQHPQIHARGELFLANSQDPDSHAAAVAASRLASWRARIAPERFAARFLTSTLEAGPGIAATGFKLMYSQIPPGFWGWSAREKPLFIHLQRRNLLKILISKAAAEHSGIRHRNAAEGHAFEAFELPVEGLIGKLERLRADIEKHERLLEDHRVTTVYYEDLLDDPERFFAELESFLGVKPEQALNLPLRKLVPDRLEEAVANATEVRAALQETRFADLTR